MLVSRRSVSVSVDEARVTVLPQQGFDRTGVYVHELWCFALFFEFARPAQGFRLLPA